MGVVAGVAAFSKDLTDGEKIKTVEGQNVVASIYMGDRIFINNALVTTADVAASNGVIHIIDTVLSLPVPKTIVDLAVATPDLSTLVAALKAGGLVSTLEGKGPFTVFAPTNEAFAKLPPLYLKLLLDPKNVKTLQKLLTYHVVAGVAAFSKDLTDGEKIKTVEGQSVVAHVSAAGVMINGATVQTADIAASNGVIHIIDKVLSLPPAPAPVPTKNIVELASSVADLSTLVTALVAGKLTTALSGKGPFTVFAPTNEAFAKLPKATLAHLLEPENIKELQLVLEYHVIPGAAIHAADLKSFQTAKTLEGQAVTIVKRNGDILVDKSKVITADVDATNGVVHIIDAVLIPPKAPMATNLTASMEQSIRATCEQQCQSSGYTCKSCTNTNCASSYNHPSCAMGCYMGHLSKTVQACESACDKGDNQCGWTFRATVMSNCQGSDNCPNQNRRGSSNAECKAGCRQATIRGPQMDSQAALQAVNRIRSRYGKAPMTWRADKKSCADKAAAYNSKHGPHKCGIDGVCKCGDRAAGDFNANDFVDAINRAYATRNSEGPADGTCDERSHCGALLAYSSIVVGYDENNFLAVIQYY